MEFKSIDPPPFYLKGLITGNELEIIFFDEANLAWIFLSKSVLHETGGS